ncbi:MAG TPA: imidazolonepropionase [Sediminispirochaeta sp.]|nr:imidazolonepropionase [Sediminispirochaeta sp.]
MKQSIYARTLYTGREVLHDTYLIFEDQLIAEVSSSPEGELLGSFEAVTPAFIDPHSHIGMARAGEPPAEAETNERMESVLAHADALDSVQMEDSSFGSSVEMGVLYSCVLPGSGNIIGGRAAVIRNYGRQTTEAFIRRAGIKAAFGYNPMSTREWKGSRPFTRMGALSILRSRLSTVAQKLERQSSLPEEKATEIEFSYEEEVFRALLERKEVLRVHVHKDDDIAALLRLVDEFGIRVTVEHSCDVHDPHIYRELASRDIPVVYGPLDSFAYKVELKNEDWRNIRHLIDSGVKFGLMTDHPVILQRNLLLTLRWFLRHGYDKQEAIELISRRNAEIIEIDDILGSLEAGKMASFSCWNGDPFELSAYPVLVVGEGRVLFSDNYEK